MFRHDASKLLVFQLRSGVCRRSRDAFLGLVLDWLKSVGVRQIVVLASSNADERIDEQLVGSQLRYLTESKKQRKVFE